MPGLKDLLTLGNSEIFIASHSYGRFILECYGARLVFHSYGKVLLYSFYFVCMTVGI